MKKYEKYLLGIFGGCAVLSAAFLLYRILVLDKGLGLFDSIDVVLPWFLSFGALFGIICRSGLMAAEKTGRSRQKAHIKALYVELYTVICSLCGNFDTFSVPRRF